MFDEVISKLIAEQHKLAKQAMTHPDPDKYLIMAGKYQGLREAQLIIEEVLQGADE